MIWFVKLRKKMRALTVMAKRKKMKGRSARHGKAQSCYQKHQKKPYVYSAEYREWKRSIVARAGKTNNKYTDENRKEQRA